MCLIIAGKSNQIRNTLLNTPELAEDIFTSNSDGIGAMYVTSKGRLRTPKYLPKNARQFIGFIKQLPNDDRALAIHARYKTHGAIDLDNCHPYPVLPNRVAMMHNGVLSQGNKGDVTKSDTWHYIKDVVRPQLEVAPGLMMLPAWQDLVADDITGSNRFVFMDDEGQMVILNRQTGIEHDGMWFSNTYAWSPELLIPGYARPKYTAPKGWSGINRYDFMDDADAEWGTQWNGYSRRSAGGSASGGSNVVTLGSPKQETKDTGVPEEISEEALQEFADEVWYAVGEADPDYVKDLLLDRPNFTLRTLFKDCEFHCSVDAATELSTSDYAYVKLLEDGDVVELCSKILFSDSNAQKIAEVICWYGDWTGKANGADETEEQVDAEALASAIRTAIEATKADSDSRIVVAH